MDELEEGISNKLKGAVLGTALLAGGGKASANLKPVNIVPNNSKTGIMKIINDVYASSEVSSPEMFKGFYKSYYDDNRNQIVVSGSNLPDMKKNLESKGLKVSEIELEGTKYLIIKESRFNY